MSSGPKFDPRKMMELAIAVMRRSVAERRADKKASPLVGAVLVNPKLQFAFAGANIAEGRGYGMKTFGAAASKYRLPLPKYAFDGVYLNLTIYRNSKAAVAALAPAIVDALSVSEREGWAWLASRELAKSKEYAAAIDSDERTARRHLNHFLELRLVRKNGSGPSTEYHVQR